MAAVGELSPEPRDTLRLLVSTGAELFLRDAVLAGFLATHPHVRLDLAVSNESTDIVERGYDAGIQLGEVIDRDMIAVPISGDLRLAVVGAPSYFARHPEPMHPRELVQHECVNWHPTPDAPPYRWEFTENGRDFSVAVPTRVLTTDPALIIRLARAQRARRLPARHAAEEPRSTPCAPLPRRGHTATVSDAVIPSVTFPVIVANSSCAPSEKTMSEASVIRLALDALPV